MLQHPPRLRTVMCLALVLAAGCDRNREGDAGLDGLRAEDHRWFPVVAGTHKLGNAAHDGPVKCESCHVSPETFGTFECIRCHEHRETATADGPGMREVHAGNAEFTYASPACLRCHPTGESGGALGRDAHEMYFPIAAGSAHQAEACASCHVDSTNRQVVSCTGCHRHDLGTSATDHGDMTAAQGYAFTSTACLQCHARSQVPGVFDHESLYRLLPPSGDGEHQPLRCVDCHGNKQARAASLDCTTCHTPVSGSDPREIHDKPYMDEVHAGIPSYAWSKRICISCHTDGTAESARTTLDHTWFPVGMGTTHALASAGGTLQCTDCHVTPGDFSRAGVSCIACHQQVDDGAAGMRDAHGEARLGDVHADVADYAWNSLRCLECHPNGEPAGAHLGFPIGNGTAHAGVGCSSCHTGPDRRDHQQVACASCHQQERNLDPTLAAIHNGIPPYAANSPACVGCHPQSEKAGVFAFPEHERHFPVASGQKHHQAASAYLARVGASQNACTACHASRTDRTQNTCRECHTEVVVPHGRVRTAERINTNADCKACHAESDVPDLANHREFSFNHEGATCRGCHGNLAACLANATCSNYRGPEDDSPNPHVTVAMRADKPWAVDWNQYACLSCHKHNRAKEESEHQGESRNGFTFQSYANPGCAKCH